LTSKLAAFFSVGVSNSYRMDANDFWDRDKWENGYTLEEPSEPIFLKLEADIFDELEKVSQISFFK